MVMVMVMVIMMSMVMLLMKISWSDTTQSLGNCMNEGLRFHYLNEVFGRFVPRVGFSKSTVVLLWPFCLLHKSFVTIISAIVIGVIKISAFWHLNGWCGYKYKTKNKYKYDHKYKYQHKDKYRYLWLPNGPASWLAACLQLAQLAAAAAPGYVTTTQGLRQIQNAKCKKSLTGK